MLRALPLPSHFHHRTSELSPKPRIRPHSPSKRHNRQPRSRETVRPIYSTCRHLSLVNVLGSRLRSLGDVQADTVQKVEIIISDQDKARRQLFEQRPPLQEILNLHDFEVSIASQLSVQTALV